MMAGSMGVALVSLLAAVLAAACCAGANEVMLDASAFESKASTPRAFQGINQTCYRLCQLDKLPAIASSQSRELALSPPAAPTQKPGNHQHTGVSGRNVASSLPTAAGTKGSSRSDNTLRSSSTTAAGARRLLNSTTTPTTNSSSTQANNGSAGASPHNTTTAGSTNSTEAPKSSPAPAGPCAALDPEAQALLERRFRGFKMHLAFSDFWELFYSLGNLVYAIDDLLKQGLASVATGKVQINAESILLFNMNIASITAWWGNLVQNMLLLTSDVIRPLPTE